MRFFLFSLLFCCIALQLNAQNTVEGRVADTNKSAIPFAEVILRALPDSNIIAIGLSDSVGSFSLSVVKKDNILLDVVAPGYKTGSLYIKEAGSPVYIQLEANTRKLEDVTVISTKPLLERKPDRIVFNISNSVSAIGSDVYDVLKKAPGVRVSENGVSIVGKSTVSIMIDEKLQYVSGNELESLLRSMSADNVSRIEVITTPPARYDAEGNAGIINIVTKKSTRNGLNGNVGLSYQQRLTGTERFTENFNYRHNKLNLYGNGFTSNYNFISEQNTVATYATQKQDQLLVQKNNPFINRYELGLDYNISDNQVIGILYTIGSTNRKTRQDYKAGVLGLATNSLDSTLLTNAIEREKALRNVVNLNYEWRIDTNGRKLSLNADYFTRTENDSRDFTTETYGASGGLVHDAVNRTLARQKVDITAFRADMVWPTDAVDISFGTKVSSIHTNSNNRFLFMNAGEYVQDAGRTSEFDYRENTQAVYASAEKTIGKFEMQAGLRAEYTQTKGLSNILVNPFTRQYLQLFPTAYIQYQPNENNSVNLNYSRRVDRPDFEQMNPFRTYGTGSSYETGNPFLQPSFSNNIELAYTLRSKYTFTLFTERVSNFITWLSKVDPANNTFYFTCDNAGNGMNTGLSASLLFTPAKWWESNVQLSGYYTKLNSGYYNVNPSGNGRIGGAFQTDNTFTCNKPRTLIATFSFQYTSRQQDDFDIQAAYYSIDLGAKALFFQKRLTCAVNMYDVFRSQLYHMTNMYNGVETNNYYGSQNLVVSLNWKLGNKKIKAIRERDKGAEEIERSK